MHAPSVPFKYALVTETGGGDKLRCKACSLLQPFERGFNLLRVIELVVVLVGTGDILWLAINGYWIVRCTNAMRSKSIKANVFLQVFAFSVRQIHLQWRLQEDLELSFFFLLRY